MEHGGTNYIKFTHWPISKITAVSLYENVMCIWSTCSVKKE